MDYKCVHNETKYPLQVILQTSDYVEYPIWNLPPWSHAPFNVPGPPLPAPRPVGIKFIALDGSFILDYISKRGDRYFENYIEDNDRLAINESKWAPYNFHLTFTKSSLPCK
ncbi:hypothetical protein Xmau_03599 [Xenorhabdus mauleonii]|uniref:Uncharacterized protein n=1 Tax=Xenorhabdus mauleonii TaxID=351675 RepID=A0A1I3X5J2_9GAMM|nr:hypothetical protein Xmau_03599 [Xenorhabdus mauleonii]SFK14111.1 hypothetical protein SAMN05421680_13147 [Xenorhabdus mauleonii]